MYRELKYKFIDRNNFYIYLYLQTLFLNLITSLYKYLKDSSVCILPSYHEGLPRSILEAMATGRPIITTNAPGCRETVLNGLNGFLIPIKNTDLLIKKIEYFINNPNKISIMGDESYKIVKQKFDINLINKQYLKALNL